MHVIATAGHVDHGKSTLVQALTGSDPDRLGEEHRRGLSIELGYCWTDLPAAGDVAFVDVPGHERFVSTMLAGVGPAPAVLFVVAADDPWMPQAAEHLAALDAFGVTQGVLAVTRSDLADPQPAAARAEAEIRRTTLGQIPTVAVSARTGFGLDALRTSLVALVNRLPAPDPDADVRLWVDRSFHLSGVGTVVTGTLPAGRIKVGDQLAHGDDVVRVRSVQTLERTVDEATGVARVALGLGGTLPHDLGRGSALVTPHAWSSTAVVDVRLRGADLPPERPLLHIGASSVAVRCRPLGDDVVRLGLERALPLRVGDRALLRDPGSRSVWGITVLDPAPPRLDRRGASRRRAAALAASTGAGDLADELRRRGIVRVSALARLGVAASPDRIAEVAMQADDWLLAKERLPALRARLRRLVEEHARSSPLEPGLPTAAAARALRLPTQDLLRAVVDAPLRIVAGRVTSGQSALPPQLLAALDTLAGELALRPYTAPDANRLRELGLDTKAIAAASKAGRLLRVSDGVVLLPGADNRALELLAKLPQPFTTSEARVQLDTTRRVILPLLEHLDRLRLTRRLPDDRRTTFPELRVN